MILGGVAVSFAIYIIAKYIAMYSKEIFMFIN